MGSISRGDTHWPETLPRDPTGSGEPATDDAGNEHARHFERKVDAQRWLDEQTSRLVAGTHVAPRHALISVGEWCDTWLDGYRGNRDSTVRQAETHLKRIKAAFGAMPLGSVRPSHVRTWCAQLAAEGLEDSYVYALHWIRACTSPRSRANRRRVSPSANPAAPAGSASPPSCGRAPSRCAAPAVGMPAAHTPPGTAMAVRTATPAVSSAAASTAPRRRSGKTYQQTAPAKRVS